MFISWLHLTKSLVGVAQFCALIRSGGFMAKVPGQSYEYVLYGSVSSSNHQALLHRLRGLCSGATAGGAPFTDREITHKIGGCTLFGAVPQRSRDITPQS